MLVIPSPAQEKNTLLERVNEQFRSEHHAARFYLCHRLDRDTSGVILFGKGKKNRQTLMELFHEKRVSKTYVALIHGKITPSEGMIRSEVTSLDKRKYSPFRKGLMAETHYRVLEEYPGFSCVEIKPVTGRSNQIRIHFQEKGCPLVGERKYTRARDYPLRFRRVALHAYQLGWPHPETGKPTEVRCPIAGDLVQFLIKQKVSLTRIASVM